jgi:hypothetical protein
MISHAIKKSNRLLAITIASIAAVKSEMNEKKRAWRGSCAM